MRNLHSILAAVAIAMAPGANAQVMKVTED